MSEFTDYDNDEALVRYANIKRKGLSLSPSQSNFKVYCILVVQVADETILIHGTNSEQGYIGGAICAERAALVQLAHHENPIIKRVIITTDSECPIAPGNMCREFLLSHATPDTIVVIANGEGSLISKCSLDALYPCKYLYRHLRRKDVLSYAEEFAINVALVTDDLHQGAAELFRRSKEVLHHDSLTALHPLQFAAGVLYDDGSIDVNWMLKALEYGSTLDPVSQLVVRMESRRVSTNFCVEVSSYDDARERSDSKPKLLLMVDQFGVCHAPFASARSLLTEHGYQDILCVVHDSSGNLSTHKASSLVPAPSGDYPLTHDDFLKMGAD